MTRLALLLSLALAACRGAGSDPKCDEARQLYVRHQRTAVDRALPSIPRDRRPEFTAQAEVEIERSAIQFAAACQRMDSGKLLACLRTPQAMDSPACEPIAADLRSRMGTGTGVPTTEN